MSEETPPAEAAESESDRKVDFPCKNCGAKATWDPESDALSCEYCGTKTQVPRGEGTIVERALEDAGSAARGLGIAVRVAHCSNCGANVTFAGESISELCVYCGSPSVLAQEANRNALRPESLVPLDVSAAQVAANFKAWLRGLWFRPNELKKAKTSDAVGVYVPFWTFDCHAHSEWSADAGYYYYVTVPRMVSVNGKMQMRMVQERRIRWEPAWGQRDDGYDDQLVNASGLSEELLQEIGSFDTKALVPYKPEYLAGWRAEEYQLDLEHGWQRSQEAVVASQRSRCAGDVPGDTHQNLRVKNTLTGVRWKHVLLPVWSLQYRFGGKTYTVLVNGQNGRVAGKAPISWAKIALLVLGVGAAVLLVLAIVALAGAVN